MHCTQSFQIATSVSCEYATDAYKLQWSKGTRNLGFHVSTDLKFTQNICKLVYIDHSGAASIFKCFLNNKVLVRAFCTYVRPILKYCTPVWSLHHMGLDDKIEETSTSFHRRN